ncbi:hypothetical protein D3C78_1539350 [compost metagenome]
MAPLCRVALLLQLADHLGNAIGNDAVQLRGRGCIGHPVADFVGQLDEAEIGDPARRPVPLIAVAHTELYPGHVAFFVSAAHE